jgi:hypothetical protein
VLDVSWWVEVLVVVSVVALGISGLGRLAVRFAYTRWWRPAYRPPGA